MEEHVKTEEDPTELDMTALFDAFFSTFKGKSSTQKTIPLKMDAFWFTNTGDTQPNANGRAGEIVDSREVSKIHYVTQRSSG